MRPVDTGQAPKVTNKRQSTEWCFGWCFREISRPRHNIAERHDEGQCRRAPGVSHSRWKDVMNETDKSLKHHSRVIFRRIPFHVEHEWCLCKLNKCHLNSASARPTTSQLHHFCGRWVKLPFMNSSDEEYNKRDTEILTDKSVFFLQNHKLFSHSPLSSQVNWTFSNVYLQKWLIDLTIFHLVESDLLSICLMMATMLK